MTTHSTLDKIPFSNLHEAAINASNSPDEHNEFALIIRTAALLNTDPITLRGYLEQFKFKGQQLSCTLLSKLSTEEIKQQLPWRVYYEQYITPTRQDIKKISLLELYTALKNSPRNPQAYAPEGLEVPFIIIDQYLRQISKKLALNPALLTCSSLRQMNEDTFVQSYPFMFDTIGQLLNDEQSDTFIPKKPRSAPKPILNPVPNSVLSPTLNPTPNPVLRLEPRFEPRLEPRPESRPASIFRSSYNKLNQTLFSRIHATLINAVQTELENELAIATTAANQLKVAPETLIRYIACFTFAGTRLSCVYLSSVSAEELKREEPWNLDYEKYIVSPKQYIQNLSLQTIYNALTEDIKMPIACAIAKLGVTSSTADNYLKKLNLTCALLREMNSDEFKAKYPLADQPFGGPTYTPRLRKNDLSKQQNTATSIEAEQAAHNSDENKIDLNEDMDMDIDLILEACSDLPKTSLEANTTTKVENSISNQNSSTTPNSQTSKKRKYEFFSPSIFNSPKQDSDDEKSIDMSIWD